MKKIVCSFIAMTAVFLLGNTKVDASTYWDDYFKDTNFWNYQNSVDYEEGCMGSTPDPNYFEPYNHFYTNGELYAAKDVKAISSDESVATVEVRQYDYSQEEKYYNDYIAWYNGLTQEEFAKTFYRVGFEESVKEDWKYFNESNPNATITFEEYLTNNNYVAYKDEDGNVQYYENIKKNSWWEFNGLKSEPKNWMEAYSEATGGRINISSTPEKVYEVVVNGHDLGDATITVTSDGTTKEVKWSQKAYGFTNGNIDGLVEIINNYEKYQERGLFPTLKDSDEVEYNFRYLTSKDDNITELLNALKGKDIKIKFETVNGGYCGLPSEGSVFGDYSFHYLSGKDITNDVNDGFSYNHDVSVDTSINKEKIESLVESSEKVFIDFTYHGNLPAQYKMTLDFSYYIEDAFDEKYCGEYSDDDYYNCLNEHQEEIDASVSDYLKNKTFTLLYYNPEKDEMEVIYEGLKTDENGNLELTFDHFSTYVVVSDDNYKLLEKKPEVTTPNTFDGITNYVILGISGMILLGGSLIYSKKCKQQ